MTWINEKLPIHTLSLDFELPSFLLSIFDRGKRNDKLFAFLVIRRQSSLLGIYWEFICRIGSEFSSKLCLYFDPVGKFESNWSSHQQGRLNLYCIIHIRLSSFKIYPISPFWTSFLLYNKIESKITRFQRFIKEFEIKYILRRV